MYLNVLALMLLFSMKISAQAVISSVNSGAYSGNNFMYSVGEIYVEPDTNPDHANSGLLGILYQIEFNVSGIDEVLQSEDFRAYPNPANQSLHFNIVTSEKLEYINILDLKGNLIRSLPGSARKADLSNLSDGVYYIKTNVESLNTLKIVKQ